MHWELCDADCARLQQHGEIDSFEPVQLEPRSWRG